MTGNEAVALLARGISGVTAPVEAELRKLASERLGEWPILLNLVNGFLRARCSRREPLSSAIASVTERLERRGLTAFDRAIEDERAAAVDKTVGIPVGLAR